MNCSILVTPLPGELYIREDAAEKYFRKPYLNYELVRVTFEKKDGSLRTMLCHRDHFMESQVKGLFDTRTSGCMTVCEEARQWRKVNLSRITEISL